jgi:hypothetical protein
MRRPDPAMIPMSLAGDRSGFSLTEILCDPPRRSRLCLGEHFHQPERPGQCRPIPGQADTAPDRFQPDRTDQMVLKRSSSLFRRQFYLGLTPVKVMLR